jgi:hypothetical protein
MVAFAAPAAWAGTFTVDRTDDPIPVGGARACTTAANDCSLRGAIEESWTTAGADTIGFDPDIFPVNLSKAITLGDALTTGDDATDELTINGPGPNVLTVLQSAQVRVFQIVGKTTINGIVIAGGRSINDAGGIRNGGNLTLNETFVTGNEALGTQGISGSGGGIYNVEGATLTLNRSTVRFNKARLTGGGIHNAGGTLTLNNSTVHDNESTSHGGGIHSSANLTGAQKTTVTNSTISDNQSGFHGGGIFSDTNLPPGTQKTTVTNSTISGNHADWRGGGIFNENGLTAIEHSTITNNDADLVSQGGGVASRGDTNTRTEVLSSIISANPGTDVDFTASTTNSFVSKGFNLIGDGNATAAFNKSGDQTNVANPSLGPLANTGGPTSTHALLSGSPAIDAGPSSPCPATDQRGVTRKDGDGNGSIVCDIGAFEKEAGPPVANPDTYRAVKNKPLKVSADKGVLKNDTGTKPFTAQLVSSPNKGTLKLKADGSLTYTPKKNITGKDTFTYRAVKGTQVSNVAKVSITIR